MLKNILLAVALFSSSAAFACAQQINAISGISKEQAQTMIIECETQKLAKINSSKLIPDQEVKKVAPVMEVVTEENLNKISKIAKTAGQTVKEVAKELNVAVNEFIKTPVGMLTAGLAVWYVAGDTISGVLDGLWDIIVGIIVLIAATLGGNYSRKFLTKKETETVVVPGLFGWYSKTKSIQSHFTWDELNSDTAGILIFIWFIQIIATAGAIGFIA